MEAPRNPLPSIEILNEWFSYDPESGLLYWRKKNSNRALIGSIAGHKTKFCIRLRFNSTFFVAHRIIWKMHYKKDPPIHIDHINRNPCDNRISNLREISHYLNVSNSNKMKRECSSKYKGVSWDPRRNKFECKIKIKGKNMFLGRFSDEKEAALAYDRKVKEMRGEYARTNF